jgi:hypothetical protein
MFLALWHSIFRFGTSLKVYLHGMLHVIQRANNLSIAVNKRAQNFPSAKHRQACICMSAKFSVEKLLQGKTIFFLYFY